VILAGWRGIDRAHAFAVPGYTPSMRAVWLEVPEAFLEERRRFGQDKKDELWDGELHMVPPPGSRHIFVARDLLNALEPVARQRGLRTMPDPAGLYGPENNWRIPDGMLVRPEMISERGAEHAELVIEVLLPNDESRAKMPWYAKRGVTELWLVEPSTRVVEVYALDAGNYRLVEPKGNVTTSALLGIELEVIAGPKLRVRDGETSTDV
jgi:Uma2 family endonuclease